MKNKSLLLILLVFVFKISSAQYATVYPTNWWVGMKHNKIQLIVRSDHESFSNEKVRINYAGVSVTGTHKFPNGKYLAVDITIASTAKPGTVKIDFTNGTKTNSVE